MKFFMYLGLALLFCVLTGAAIIITLNTPMALFLLTAMIYCGVMAEREIEKKMPKPTVIVCAANKLKSGLIVCGARHHDPIMNAQIAAAGDTHVGEEQGFLDNKGNFLTREEAFKIAYWNKQRKYRCGGDKKTLYSENLY